MSNASRGRVIAVIPARGGSKGLPRKNLRILAGVPLIVHSIRAAQEAELVDLVIVSTEDVEIADVAEAHGAQVVQRPPELATDMAQNDAVVRHALETVRVPAHVGDIAVLLQPTSPLRRARDIDACVALFRQGGVETVLSVCEVDVHPGKCVYIRDGRIEPFTTDWDMEARRQEMQVVYRQNGAVYVVEADNFMKNGRFYRKPCGAYEMDRRDSIDIDDELDLQLAENLLKLRGVDKR